MFTFTCVLLHKEHITAVWRGQCRSLVSEGRLFLVVFSMKSSIANLFGDDSCLPGVSEASNCGSSLARFSSLWCAIMPCKSIRLCSAKISVMDLYFLLMVQSCKTMYRSSSYNGVDSYYPFQVSEKTHLVVNLVPGFYRILTAVGIAPRNNPERIFQAFLILAPVAEFFSGPVQP